MKRIRHGAAALLFTAAVAGSASAGTIDTRPGNNFAGINSTNFSGQTFTADDRNLFSFSFILGNGGSVGFTVVGEVYDTAGGVPTGPALFTSGPVAPGAVASEFVFTTTGVPLTAGNLYAIVARPVAPGLTGVIGRTFPVGPYAGGQQVFTVTSGAAWAGSGGPDLSTLIVMNPEPGTFALYALGLVGLGVAVRRRRRADAKR